MRFMVSLHDQAGFIVRASVTANHVVISEEVQLCMLVPYDIS